MKVKDNFSTQAKAYAAHRPTYPEALVRELVMLTNEQENVWDCATGNGQLAALLSPWFSSVYATDISQKQLDHAVQKENIGYRLATAEAPGFPDGFFDLVTVGQAVHWFDFQRFYETVRRVGKPNSILAIIGYGMFKSHPKLDAVVQHFYVDITGPYWDPERRYLDEKYQTIPFPFEEIHLSPHKMRLNWTLDDMVGYLNTWSALHHYIRANESNPIDLIIKDLEQNWGSDETIAVTWDVLTRVGKINS
jgi:ubiquinone/menaquinone biosynthesis C-methylase UbiE